MTVATRKSASRAKRAAPQPAPAPSWLGRLLRQIYQPAFLFPLALSLGAIITWPYLPAWAPDLSSELEYQLTADRLILPPGHDWIPDQFVDRVLTRAGATPERPLSLLRDGLAERLAKSLALEPWVKEVRQVRQDRRGNVTVDLEYRHPVLMVSTARGMYAVDGEGVLLPPEDFRAEDIRRFPLARNVSTLPRVGAGDVWSDPAVLGAARLAALLTPQQDETDPWRSLGLVAILLPQSPPNGGQPLTYELQTTGGSRIIWGHAPGGDSLEPSPDQKLARLVYYREQCGGFETAQGPTRIDIRDIEVIYAGALTENRQ